MQKHQRLVLVVAILASFVSFLDGSVVTVALPSIMRDLGGGLVTQQWVVDAYTLTLGALILVAGSLSDVFGRVVILRTGLMLFGLASLLCTIAPGAEFLVIARAIQGIGGALLVPSSLALILSTFSGAAQAKAIGQWTGFTSVAFITGPLIGGVFVDLLSWRLVFAINVVPILVTLYLLFRLRQKDEREPGVVVDFPGAILGVFGLGLPVFALIEQGDYGFASPIIWGSLVLGSLALAAFFWRERVAKQPMVPLALFRVRNFSFGNVTTTLVYGAISMGGFLLAIYLQQVGGYKATFAGLATLPVTVISILLSPTIGGLAGRFGARLFMTVGPFLAGAGFLYYVFFTSAHPFYWTEILPGVLLFGLGMTITVAPLTSSILGAIDPHQAGIGSAINNAVSRIAGLIAIGFLGLIVGEQLTLGGFRRGMLVAAILLFAGGTVSFVGIRATTVRASPPGVRESVPPAER